MKGKPPVYIDTGYLLCKALHKTIYLLCLKQIMV